MHSNQRARLVLRPIFLIALLLLIGLGVGLGIALRRGGDSTASGRDSSAHPIRLAGLQISSDHLDFGNIDLERTVSRQLQITNEGAAPLGLRIEGSDAFVVEPRTLTVPPGGRTQVTVTASPKRAGAIRDELRIFQDGATHAPLVVLLEGNARGGGDAMARSGQNGGGVPGATVGGSDIASAGGAPSYGVPGETGSVSGGGAQPPGSVSVTRSTSEPGGADEGTDIGNSGSGASGSRTSPGGLVAPVGIGTTGPRSMADPPAVASGAANDGEEPVPVRRNPKNPSTLEPKDPDDADEPTPTAPAFVITATSSISLMGTTNQFYPQQVGVFGAESGGSFSLASSLQWPKIPLAFGQSMQFSQSGGAVGTFDASSGQVTISLALNAMDSNGNSAPIPMNLSTGTVVTRNSSGVLISLTGQPRTPGTGQLRLVGVAKIPPGYRNQAEEQLVMVDLYGVLGFGSSGAGNASNTD